MAATTQLLTSIFYQRAHIGAFGTIHFEFQLIAFDAQNAKIINRYRARFTLHGLAFTGQFVKRHTLVLDRRIHAWHLFDIPLEGHQGVFNLCRRRRHRCGADHITVRIAGFGNHSQLGGDPIAFVRLQQELAEFGGLTKTDRQHAGGQRIQAAGVTGLGRGKHFLDHLQGAITADTTDFIQQQDAVDVTATRTTFCHLTAPLH